MCLVCFNKNLTYAHASKAKYSHFCFGFVSTVIEIHVMPLDWPKGAEGRSQI